MTIQSITGNTNNVVLQSKSTANTKVKDVGEQTKDSVDITEVAKKITSALNSTKTSSVINEERVSAIKNSLEQGTYTINAEQIADKMIQMEGEQFNSR
jgi:negative regulator of flagellin synthesis FlgM